MKWTTIVAALAIIASVNSADAGLFGSHHKRSDCCCPAPSCCAPAATCCPDPCCAAPACCPDACGCAAPATCCPDQCCPQGCGRKHGGLFGKCFKRNRCGKRDCCDTCAAPSCCAPACDPCCAAPVGCCN